MLRRLVLLSSAGVLILFAGDRPSGPIAAETALPLLKATEPAEFCLRPDLFYDTQAGQRSGGPTGALAVPADWPGSDVPGGDVPPTRIVADPFPTFDGIAVDPENGIVAMSDENRSGLFIYDRAGGSQSHENHRAETAHHRSADRPRVHCRGGLGPEEPRGVGRQQRRRGRRRLLVRPARRRQADPRAGRSAPVVGPLARHEPRGRSR